VITPWMPSVARNPDTVDIEHDFKIPPMCHIKLRNVGHKVNKNRLEVDVGRISPVVDLTA
jgi:hypothetical protein